MLSGFFHQLPGNIPDSSITTIPLQTTIAAEHLSSFNTRNSLLISLPPELLRLVISYLTDPLDLLRFSYTCHELFFITAPADWYSLATSTYTNWALPCEGPKARDWK